MNDPDLHRRLGAQALRRELTDAEQALAAGLEAIYAAGIHDFEKVTAELNARAIARPSGAREPWSVAALQSELAAINASLDEAYAAAPAISPYGRVAPFMGER
ncbi:MULTISPECIES: recombinase-like helix-turn-helix domain-containing protein [unclassified Beijerinckia]|uniref:recombinase-like helix-turn-helix domain-containing protein n=1 Tax=unclassified Beijerinckia TaxID=2638183 RepID=UPI000897F19E|nr:MULTISPECIES: recombinase-like helix-turn-helix domain-containing protein [unclassified Beijerinckia]MDH7795198.1 uncharacterized protein with beta-barrel porin domain [Beijerinckia sp. GAS462]SEB91674.1 hypothetical protein SAMN05443249_1471 [Beijerinckia sp. 28-YEA-48]